MRAPFEIDVPFTQRPAMSVAQSDDDVTELLVSWRAGSEEAGARLSELVQATLRAVAASYLRRERPNHTLQPTELVNEAYLRLLKGAKGPIADRAHFFVIAARIMRRILVDHARRRRAGKRAGFSGEPTSLSKVPDGNAVDLADVLSLDMAMNDLAALDDRQARILELRYFGGLAVDDIGAALKISPATVKRELMTGKLWLRRRLRHRIADAK